MTQKTLQKAKEIESEIDGLKGTLNNILNKNRINNHLELQLSDSSGKTWLRNKYLPSTVEDFLNEYCINISKEIDRLEKEFEKL
ncbi:MAG: hypothetical protein LBP63_11095 [Prevotellaceae bacterium]|jgi:hypothetical protein|nr:hypothetical protein [Prevotellaceae bacterium]